MKRLLQGTLRTIGIALGPWILSVLGRLRPVSEIGRTHAEQAWQTNAVIVVFWHARFLLLPFIYPKDRKIGVLISPSADGDLIASIIERLGRNTIRGSSRGHSREALAEMKSALNAGCDVGIAIDGPLGPAYECKMGAVRLAQVSGLPILPLTYTTRRGWALPTWDRFWIPAPFSRIQYHWGQPVYVADDADLEVENRNLQQKLRQLLQDAESWTGRTLPWES